MIGSEVGNIKLGEGKRKDFLKGEVNTGESVNSGAIQSSF